MSEEVYAWGMKDQRIVAARRLAVDAALRDDAARWTGLQFKVRVHAPRVMQLLRRLFSVHSAAFRESLRTPTPPPPPAAVGLQPAADPPPYGAPPLPPLTPLPSPSTPHSPALRPQPEQTVIFSPLRWTNPDTGAQNATGLISIAFTWEKLLNNTIPPACSIWVVVNSPNATSNYDFAGTGLNVDSSRFTMRLTGGTVTNVGWGASRPPPLPPACFCPVFSSAAFDSQGEE